MRFLITKAMMFGLLFVPAPSLAQIPSAQRQMNSQIEKWHKTLSLQECLYTHHASDIDSGRIRTLNYADIDSECQSKIAEWRRKSWDIYDTRKAINSFLSFSIWRCVVASSSKAVDDINRIQRQVNDRQNLRKATINPTISKAEYMLWFSSKYPMNEQTVGLARACANNLNVRYRNDDRSGWTSRLLFTPLITFSLFT